MAERKERRESAMTLFFSVVRPHLALLLSISFHSGFVSMETDRLCVYPTLQEAPEMLVCLSFSFILLGCYSSVLSLTVTVLLHSFITSSLHPATLVLAFQVLSKYRWHLDMAAQIYLHLAKGPASKRCRDSNVVRHESLGFRF